jgi:hypothetical protein
MKFTVGDLVFLSPLCGGKAELSSTPVFSSIEDSRIVGYFYGAEIAVVIDVNLNDCSSVLVLTQGSLGWLAGAWIKKIS